MYGSLQKNQKGVSIAELSIVIIVIALLVGIVAGGSHLKKAAEVRSIITDVNSFNVAVDGFVEKYRELPGDISDAHSYWDDGANGVCGTAAQCNGDGDGLIEEGGAANDHESFRAWQHLALSGFVEGDYTGVAGNTKRADVGVNVPATKRSRGGYYLFSFDAVQDDDYGAGIISVGKYDEIDGDNWPSTALLTPVEALSIDNKMDDGLPDSGKVNGRYGYTDSWQDTECLAGSYPDRTYDVTGADEECILFFSY